MKMADQTIEPGQVTCINLPVAQLYTHTQVHIPVNVIRGPQDGPTLFLCSTVHGDEINGIEIVRKIFTLCSRHIQSLRGTVICVPVVNVFGLLNKDRYLPDRRDLNRSFPGSSKGPLAKVMAKIMYDQFISQAQIIVDCHTGSNNHFNFPQIRVDFDDESSFKLARIYNPPLIVNSQLRRGSLRRMSRKLQVPTLVYEAGEALRFDDFSIDVGMLGILRVMSHLRMLKLGPRSELGQLLSAARGAPPILVSKDHWIRAPLSGILRTRCQPGDVIGRGDILGVVSDPSHIQGKEIRSNVKGVIIGQQMMPLINKGEALFHVAEMKQTISFQRKCRALRKLFSNGPMYELNKREHEGS